MERRFKNISYDLAQNIIYEGKEEPKSLKYYSLIFLIAHRSKKTRGMKNSYIMNLVLENIIRIKCSTDPFHNSEIANEMAGKITEFCILPLLLKKKIDVNKFRPFVKETIFFVVVQICDMIGKNIISTDDIRDVLLILNNLVLTCQGTINLRKTVIRILDRGNAKDYTLYDQCVLACYYFIEEAVVIRNSERVPMKKFEDYFNSRSKDSAMYHFFKFWKWFIDKNREDVQKVTNGYQTYINKIEFPYLNEGECIELSNVFKQAVLCNNETSVQYLWDDYISRMPNKVQILEEVLTLAIPHTNKTNIIMFLIFQINNNELEGFFKSNYFTIIQNIVKNIRWHSLFPKIFNEFENYFNANEFLKLMTDLTNTYFIDYSTSIDLALYFLNLFPDYFKQLLANKPDEIYNNLLTKPLLYAKEDVVRTLLKLINETDLKNFLSSKCGINLLAETIKNGKLNFHDKILLEFLARDTILKIKRSLFYDKIQIFTEDFMELLQFENLRYLVDWLSDAVPDQISEFKVSLAHRYNGSCLRKILFRTDTAKHYMPTATAYDFLYWCLRSKESISSFKQNIILCPSQTYTGDKELILWYDDLKTLMLESKLDRIRVFLNWMDCTLDKKKSLLQDLLKDNEFYSRIISKAKNEKLSLGLLLYFLQHNLYLNVEDFIIFRRKIFEVILEEEPAILSKLTSRYGHHISEEYFYSFLNEDPNLNKTYGILNSLRFQS